MASKLEICNLALDHIGEKPITLAELIAKAPKAARLLDAHWDIVLDEVLEAHPWNFAKKHWPLEYMAGFAEYLAADEMTITGISQASPGVVTAVAHGWLTDYTIRIKNVVGMTEVNDRIFQVTKMTADTASLNNIDTAQYTAYTSAGSAVRMEALPKYQPGGFTYKVPYDLLKPLSIQGGGEFEIIGGVGMTSPIRRILTTTEDAVLIGIAINRPQFLDINATVLTMDASAVTGTGIGLVASGVFFESTHAGAYFAMHGGYVKVTAVTDTTNAVVDVIEDLTAHTATADWFESTDTEWDSRFIKVLAARLAAEVALPITKKLNIEKSMWGLYQFHLGDSAVKDSRESNIKPPTKDSWLTKAGYE